MTLFISDYTTPQQPAFIYATYPTGTSVTSDTADAGSDPSSVLVADESAGHSFDCTVERSALNVACPAAVSCNAFAVCGSGLIGAQIEVWGSNDGFATSTQLLAATQATDDRVFWSRHDFGSYTAYKYVFIGLNTKSKIKHLAPTVLALLPFLEDGACLEPLQAEGDHLISHAGLFLGSTTNRVMRTFSLAFGQVTPVEKALFDGMVDACVKTAQGLFFVPDAGRPEAHFGWVDKKYKYEPKRKLGMHEIPTIPFTSRAV